MLRNYLKTAKRNILANKVFSFINVTGLAIGLACCMLIVLYVKDELSYDHFHKNIARIFQLTCDRIEKNGTTEKFGIAAMAQGPAFKRGIPDIEEFVRVCPKQATIRTGKANIAENITWADENFFSFFSFPLKQGNAKIALSDPHSVVITEAAAKKYFGTLDIIGKTLEVEVNSNFEQFKITAVAQAAPQNSSIKFNVVLPFKYLEETSPDNGWMWVSYPTYFLLNRHADIKSTQSKMQQVYATQATDEIEMNRVAGYETKFLWSLTPFKEMHLNTEYKGSFEPSDPLYYRILAGIAIFILLIACINFINLSIANSLKRHKEIGIRKVLGGIKKQLIIQFLCDSSLLCFIAFLTGLLFTSLLLPFFNHLAGKALSIGYLFDPVLILVFLFLFLITCFFSGIYPALVLSALNPVKALYGNSKSPGKSRLLNALIVTQFSLGTLFIIAVSVMMLQFNYLTKMNLGYNQRNLLEFTVEKAITDQRLMNVLKSEFERVPGVVSVGFCNVGKFGGKTIAAGRQFDATYQRVDEQFVHTMDIHLTNGRNFATNFPSDSLDAVIINETFAHKAGWGEPIGKTIDFMNIPGWGNKKVIVVGIVRDYHFESLKEKIKPLVLTMDKHLPLGKFVVRINEHDVPSTLSVFGKKYQSLIPGHPFQFEFKEDANRIAYDKDARWKSIISFGACIMVFISCIGLFGFSMLSTKKRAKEFAIRRVVGVTQTKLLFMVSIEFIKPVFLAFIIAAPFGWWAANKWLQGFAYRIGISWQPFVFTGLLVLGVVLLTVCYHVVKAVGANPVISLRQE